MFDLIDIVNKDTKTCERRLPLGYFPKLSTTADKNQHVLAESKLEHFDSKFSFEMFSLAVTVKSNRLL